MVLTAETIFIVAATLMLALLAFALRAAARRSTRAGALVRDAEIASRERLERAESRSNNIIHRALRQARSLLARSEIASIKEHASEALQHHKLHKLSREGLGKLTENVAAEMSADAVEARKLREKALAGIREELTKVLETSRASLESASRAHQQFLEGVRAEISAERAAQKGVGDEILSKYARSAEEELRDLGRSAAALIRERVDEEVREIRSSLKGYTDARQRLVDEHIVELVERTAAIALTESLSLAEHSRLVYRALEEARREGFFEMKKEK